ncbi:MAG: hypothetical protein CSA42_01870 [Gammaproteobacteria bacterium]|nr:MAG: hypothetical protein CSA42_01870 [Gammaproteobacteria bacterium]
MKNALQAQLLKAGLVDKKKAKKINKQTAHAKRTGDASVDEARKAVAQAKAEKLAKDQQLNKQKQQALEEKTLKSNIEQMINQHQIDDITGEVEYQFVDGAKVKKLYITQKMYDQLVAGHVVIARKQAGYALLPHPLAQRINQKMAGFIIETANKNDTPTEDDPYAAYVIPDDLMW